MGDSSDLGSQGSFGFSGHFRLKVDAKGRLTLPSLYRRALPVEEEQWLVLRRGAEPFVQVMPQREWGRIQALERQRPGRSTGPARQWEVRKLSFGVSHSQLDQKGRMTVSQDLLSHAGIEGEALVIGSGRHMELWKPETYFALEAQHAVDESVIDDLLYE